MSTRCENERMGPGEVSIDTETTGLLWRHGDRGFSFSLCDTNYNSFYAEFYVDPLTREVDYDSFSPGPCPDGFSKTWKPRNYIEYLAEISEDAKRPKVFHNAKFDTGILRMMDVQVHGEVHDTKLMARIFNSDEGSYSLKPLAYKHCGIPLDDIEELKRWVDSLRRKARQQGWKVHKDREADYWLVQQADVLLDISEAEALRIQLLAEDYCRKDTVRTMALYQKYFPEISGCESDATVYRREQELMQMVLEMEERGVATNRLIAISDRENSVKLAKYHLENVRKFAGDPYFNPNSAAQLQKLVYEKMGIQATKFTPGGAPSADYKILKDNESSHPVMHDIIQYKAHERAVNGFFDNYIALMLPDKLNPGGYVVHPNFNQDNTRTGRFSCDTPNLQQVSNPDSSFKGTDVIQARNAFGPRPGYTWYMMDYAQMELRVFAGCANVQQIITDILTGKDPNTEIANRAWGGRGNPTAIRQATLSMELGNIEPTSIEVRDAWKEYGWSPELAAKGERTSEAMLVAEQWLKDHDYDIVKAEKAIGKKITRNRAKMVMFAKLYGGGPKAVQGLLYCSMNQAKEFLNDIDKVYPQINRYMRRLTREALDEGYITNKYGRKLKISRERAYTSVNYMIQGTSADMIKVSMLDCTRFMKHEAQIDGHIVMTIHDEIVFEIRDGHATPKVLDGLKFRMEDHEKYVGVPMEIGIKKAVKQWSLDEPVSY